jgi:undecaprenyl pyrophosphate phosphatase UppP
MMQTHRVRVWIVSSHACIPSLRLGLALYIHVEEHLNLAMHMFDCWGLIIENIVILLIPYALATSDRNLHEEWR